MRLVDTDYIRVVKGFIVIRYWAQNLAIVKYCFKIMSVIRYDTKILFVIKP